MPSASGRSKTDKDQGSDTVRYIEKKISLTLFLAGLIFVLAVHDGYTAETQALSNKHVKIKGAQEILVARDASGGRMLYGPEWCGSNALLFNTSDGIALIDVTSKEKITISSDRDDRRLNCTPDGKWVFYYRWSRDIFFPNPDYDGSTYDASTGMDANEAQPLIKVIEIYRYEVATGIRQRLAITSSIGSSRDLVSPDGKKILLGPEYHIVMAEAPELRFLWFNNTGWWMGEQAWFKDSSGVVAFVPGRLGVEFFGENGWAKSFDLWKPGIGISSLKVDLENRIYFETTETALEMSDGILPQLHGNYLIHRCAIKAMSLDCERIMARENLGPFEILPDGDIIFEVIYDKCLHRFSSGKADEGCEIEARYGNDTYDDVHVIGTSPDGKRFAFERFKETAVFKGMERDRKYSRYDLFFIEITDQGEHPW